MNEPTLSEIWRPSLLTVRAMSWPIQCFVLLRLMDFICNRHGRNLRGLDCMLLSAAEHDVASRHIWPNTLTVAAPLPTPDTQRAIPPISHSPPANLLEACLERRRSS